MSKCFDHKTTFADTHKHLGPAIEISRKIPIVCGGLELKKINVKTRSLDPQPMFLNFSMFEEMVLGTNVKKNKG